MNKTAAYILLFLLEIATSAKDFNNVTSNRNCSILSVTSASFSTKLLFIAHNAVAMSLLSYLLWEDQFQQPIPRLPSIVSLGLAGGSIYRNLQWELHRIQCKIKYHTYKHIDAALIKLKIKREGKIPSQVPFNCPSRGSYAETFHIKWFFNNFHEGIWHDTEVMIAESKDTVVIAFRGSDSPVDVATNVQSMEAILFNGAFPSCKTGSIHRGIFNAYSRVHSGHIVDLTDFTHPAQYKHGDKYLRGLFSACIGGNFSTANICAVENQPLASILKNIAISALQNPRKRLVITGHSLGGALGTLLALDLLVHYISPRPPTSRRARWMHKINPFRSHRNTTQGLAVDAIDRMYLQTFGEVEYADELLLSCLMAHPAVDAFLRSGHYKRFVSLTTAPLCKSDVVTRIASKLIDKIPAVLSGKGGGRMERRRKRLKAAAAENTSEGSQRHVKLIHLVGPSYLSSGTAINTIDAHSLSHYMRGMAYLAREGTARRSRYPLYLINNLPYYLSVDLGLARGGACYNNSYSPIFYGYDC